MSFGTTYGVAFGSTSGGAPPAAPEPEAPVGMFDLGIEVLDPPEDDLGWQKLLSTQLDLADIQATEVDTHPFVDSVYQRLLSTPLDLSQAIETAPDATTYTEPVYRRLLSTSLDYSAAIGTEEDASRPFIDSLTPCTVGSDYRKAALSAAKIETTATLPVLSPPPGGTAAPSTTIFIPAGDRIIERYTTEVDPGESIPVEDPPGLDDSRTIIMINDTVVYRDSTQQASWTVAKTPNDINGFDYELTGPGGLLPLGSIDVSVHLEGVRSFDDTYNFSSVEGDPPYLDNEDPAPDETGVAKAKVLTFDLLDDLSGIDLTTVLIYVEGALAYQGSTDAFQAPYNGGSSLRTPIANGHNFDIQKTSDWDSYSFVSVRVVAEDTVGNPLDTTYSFRIEDYVAPTITNESPTGTGVARDATISFEIRDVGGIGIDSSTIDAQVDSIDAIIDGVFQAGFSGTIIANAFNGYDVTLNKTSNFGSYATVTVDAYVEDLDGNPATTNWSFEVEDYLGPLLNTLEPDDGDTGVPRDTLISFTLEDESSVVLSSVVIRVDRGAGWEIAYTGSAFQPGWDGPSSNVIPGELFTGYIFVIDPTTDLPSATVVTVEVTAEDGFGNPERLP